MKAIALSYLIIGMVTAGACFLDHRPYFRAGRGVKDMGLTAWLLTLLTAMTALLWPYSLYHDCRVSARRAKEGPDHDN